MRRNILTAFEEAEVEPHRAHRAALLTFVVVGAGPTGVEMAGQIAEIGRDTLRGNYRRFEPADGRILLVEMADRVLTAFPESLSEKAARSLRSLGVTLMTGHAVTGIDADGVTVQADGEEPQHIPARTVVWAAGVTASVLADHLAQAAGAETDRAGRMTVAPDLTVPGHPEIFAIGDMVRVQDAKGGVQDLPGLAPVAMQEGRHAARAVRERLEGRSHGPFRYVDKGNLATIGRGRAVGDLKGVHLERPAGVADVAARAPLLPRGLPEPGPGLPAVGGELRHARARRAAHHLPGLGARRGAPRGSRRTLRRRPVPLGAERRPGAS